MVRDKEQGHGKDFRGFQILLSAIELDLARIEGAAKLAKERAAE
jgi:hypothetical protein